MQEYRADAECIGDGAAKLTAGAAKSVQHAILRVVAARDRDALDRGRHVLDGDGECAGRNGLGRLSHSPCKFGEALSHDGIVQRLVAVRPEQTWKVIGRDPPEQEVAVGHGERPAPAVAGRTGIGSGRGGADR